MSGNPYNPVQDYMDQLGIDSLEGYSDAEIALLKTLSRHEVDALVSMDNKGKSVHPVMRVGSQGY
jgi:hypothetical protein